MTEPTDMTDRDDLDTAHGDDTGTTPGWEPPPWLDDADEYEWDTR